MKKLNKMDAIKFLKKLKPESVDCVITDIAYESLEKHRKVGTTTRLKKKWFDIFPNKRIPELFHELYRVMKDGSHLYFFSDVDTMFLAKPIGEDAGFKFWKPIIWDKVHIGMGYHYRNRTERILFFEKGKRRLNNLSISDVLSFPRIHCSKYPTQKPIELMKVLIEQSTRTGETVIDPFMGSGSVYFACTALNRQFYGSDINQDSLDFIKSYEVENIIL